MPEDLKAVEAVANPLQIIGQSGFLINANLNVFVFCLVAHRYLQAASYKEYLPGAEACRFM
jgi:hypothetical protein